MQDKDIFTQTILATAKKLLNEGKVAEAYQQLAEPLHEALYQRQDFNLLEELPAVQRLVLAFDYVQTQVAQGGFIQLIQNGYVSLLVTVIEAMQKLSVGEAMVPVLDDALKIFVLNREALSQETSVAAFSKLYAEFREFEPLEKQFMELLQPTQIAIVAAS